MKAILISYDHERIIQVEVVEISPDHAFSNGPYVDTVPFSVGSNQSIVEYDETHLSRLRKIVRKSCQNCKGTGTVTRLACEKTIEPCPFCS